MRWPCKFSVMPFFYIFLVCVTVGVTCADYYLYEYDYWYIQGSAMLLIVGITMLAFGFGRVRMGKIEAKREKEAESATASNNESPVSVVRNGIQFVIPRGDLTVGDKVLLSYGQLAPADCVVFQSGSELVVNESAITGEPDSVSKKSLGHYN